MNTPLLPSVELVQGPQHAEQIPQKRGWRRSKVFFLVLLLSAAIGAAIVYGRSPVYRASASVLTVKPKAIDTRSAAADVEHVTIQSRLLLGDEMLDDLSKGLIEGGSGVDKTAEELRQQLGVVAVPNTNLLELRAEGTDPAALKQIVNLWAELYEKLRAKQIEEISDRTTAEIEDQQTELEGKIEAARAEILAFREANDIVGLERDENRSLSRLKGLNNSVNKAREKLVDAQAHQRSVEEAIARGETVIPNEQKADISKLQRQLRRKQTQLANLRSKYTQVYIERDPKLKALPDDVAELQDELRSTLEQARITVRDEAMQAVAAAEVSVEELERKLADHQKNVQAFTEQFKEFKALEEGLARLERLYAENKERLAEIQVTNLEKFPPIQVVEWAREPGTPIYPDYQRDILIAMGIAFGVALLVTWLVEYLSERSKPAATPPYLGIRIYPGDQAQALGASQANAHLGYQPGPAAQLNTPPPNLPVLPRELSVAELSSLVVVAEPKIAAHAALLLSGVSPFEFPLLHAGCLHPADRYIDIPGSSPRAINIADSVWRRLEPIQSMLAKTRGLMSLPDLDAGLAGAARDAQLTDPGSINAMALWHSYVVFLIRQGIDREDLVRRVGAIPPEVNATLMHFAPPGGPRSLPNIEFTHPVVAIG